MLRQLVDISNVDLKAVLISVTLLVFTLLVWVLSLRPPPWEPPPEEARTAARMRLSVSCTLALTPAPRSCHTCAGSA
jgi:hypothetical protein